MTFGHPANSGSAVDINPATAVARNARGRTCASVNETLPHLRFTSQWTSEEVTWSNSRGHLLLRHADGADLTVELQRCARGRLRNAYPVSSHDLEVQVGGAESTDVLTASLGAVVTAIEAAEPQCRRIVYAVDTDGSFSGAVGRLSVIAAAEAAGFRYVVDVDLADAELSLLVAEPRWVTEVDMDLDHVPGT
ncbi:hypothetical protein [Rhodococcus opacus]|uniref:hypothetical protein n=1 Tax=Rhodococcus opacus TaxID=37919 RepID=UPI001C45470D|nr:hypothetical protein [Rhodococcus opacus]MBV6760411.1 hypothetical protein [Rhodococcus opacus]